MAQLYLVTTGVLATAFILNRIDPKDFWASPGSSPASKDSMKHQVRIFLALKYCLQAHLQNIILKSKESENINFPILIYQNTMMRPHLIPGKYKWN